jgi:hypothetical protein
VDEGSRARKTLGLICDFAVHAFASSFRKASAVLKARSIGIRQETMDSRFRGNDDIAMRRQYTPFVWSVQLNLPIDERELKRGVLRVRRLELENELETRLQ